MARVAVRVGPRQPGRPSRHRGKVRRETTKTTSWSCPASAAFSSPFDQLSGWRGSGEFGETGYGMVVADGMGGMAGGEVASRLAVTLLLDLVLDTSDWIMGRGEADATR